MVKLDYITTKILGGSQLIATLTVFRYNAGALVMQYGMRSMCGKIVLPIPRYIPSGTSPLSLLEN